MRVGHTPPDAVKRQRGAGVCSECGGFFEYCDRGASPSGAQPGGFVGGKGGENEGGGDEEGAGLECGEVMCIIV